MEALLRSRSQSPGPLENLNDQGAKDEAGLSQLTHFHLFKNLPPELRQMIYHACIPRRTFKFCYYRWSTLSNGGRYLGKKPAALPLIAFVSKEAYHISKLRLQEFEVILRDISGWPSFNEPDETTRIRFDLDLDTLFIGHIIILRTRNSNRDRLKHLQNGAFALTMRPKVNLILDMIDLAPLRLRYLVPSATWRMPYPNYDILAQKSHCTVVLAKTTFSAKEHEIRASGLFGMFGEERTVFVDIDDTVKIDQFETYIQRLSSRGSRQDDCEDRDSFFPQEHLYERGIWDDLGAGRYGSFGAASFDEDRIHGRELAPTPPSVHSVAGRHSVAEQDAASARYLIQQAWLETNRCFEPAHSPLVPWTGDARHRKWDNEHPVAKHWLSNLPTFSFVVMFQVTEEGKTALEHEASPSRAKGQD